jgi:probable HAF family extracellular repeat protein
LWQNGTVRDLGTLGGPAAYARFIDSRGRVAGQSYIRSHQSIQPPPTPLWPDGTPLIHPFFWENGRMTDIGTLGGVFAEAKAMNSLGQVVGYSDLRGDAAFHAFRWTQGKMVDLGTVGDANSVADAINDLGAVVGALISANGRDGFLWRDGVMIDLGALPGFPCNSPRRINNKGQVVGTSDLDCNEGGETAWLWQEGVGLVDLNTLVPPGTDMHLANAWFINDSGEIVGKGMLPNGDFHAFALIPSGSASDSSAAVGSNAAAGDAKATDAASLKLSPAKVAELRARLAHRAHGFLDRSKGPS